jgi:type II secretory pathway component PulM
LAKGHKYSILERVNLSEAYNLLMGLNSRQQIMAIGGVVFLLLLIIMIPITCASSKLGKLQKQIDNHEKNVSQVIQKVAELQKAQAQFQKFQNKIRPKSQIQLTTKIETLATQSNIGQNIDSLKEVSGTPGEDFEEVVVSVRLTKLPLGQLSEFLYDLEKQPDLPLSIKRLQIKPRFDNRQLFDAVFEVSTLALVEKEG